MLLFVPEHKTSRKFYIRILWEILERTACAKVSFWVVFIVVVVVRVCVLGAACAIHTLLVADHCLLHTELVYASFRVLLLFFYFLFLLSGQPLSKAAAALRLNRFNQFQNFDIDFVFM